MAISFKKIHADNIIEGINKLFLTSAERTDIAGALQSSLNLSDLANIVTARTNLGLGSASTVDVGLLEGNIPVLSASGKLPDSVIPALAISDTSVVADITARNLLTPQTGDIAVVTNSGIDHDGDGINEPATYIWDGTSWIELKSDTSKVSSVNNLTGVVTISASNLDGSAVSNVEFNYLTGVTSSIQTQLDNKLDDSQLDISIDLGGDLASDTKISSQKAVKNHVEEQSKKIALIFG
jgi:hypothetical protein